MHEIRQWMHVAARLISESIKPFDVVLEVSRSMLPDLQALLPHVRRTLEPKRNSVWVLASDRDNGRGIPTTIPGADCCGIAVKLFAAEDGITLRFVEITSNRKGMGRTMVATVLQHVPPEVKIKVTDWSHRDDGTSFWQTIKAEHPDHEWII